MKDVTGQWRFRDGRPMVAAYAQGNTILAIGEDGWRSDLYDAWKHNESADAIMPVEPPKVWRPFRDIAEARDVMGPMPWMRQSLSEHQWSIPTWNAFAGLIWGYKAGELLDSFVWTNDPSKTEGSRCGVEE